MRRACIDIGSNTTRLLVADCRGPMLVELHQERSFTQIGRALLGDGTIGPEKIDEVCGVVAEQLESARRLGAVEIRCVATASIRRAANGAELVEAIRRACGGLGVEILSGEREAHLAFIGVARTAEFELPRSLAVVDVGGGSSELVIGEPPETVNWWVSMPIGSGDIAAEFLRTDPPARGDIDAARRRVAELLAEIRPPQVDAAVAVGGSATSLHRLVGPVLDAPAFVRSLELLAHTCAADVASRFALDIERVRLLPAGITILHAISESLGAPLVIGRGGIREGVLLVGKPLRQLSDVRC